MSTFSGAYRVALRTPTNKKRLAFSLIILVSLFASLGLSHLGMMGDIENRTWDWRVKLAVRSNKADPRIKIIEVTQDSLNRREKDDIVWPWPREMYAAVLSFLKRSGAKGVAFDVLFTERSRYGPKDDEAFVDAMKDGFPVVSAVVLSQGSKGGETAEDIEHDSLMRGDHELFLERQRKQTFRPRFETLLDKKTASLQYPSVTLPIPELLRHSAGFGNVSAAQDSDGVFRHYLVGGYFKGVPVLNLPFELYNSTVGDPLKEYELGPYLDQNGQLTVQFQSPHGSYSPTDINSVIDSYVALENGDQPELSLDFFRDSWVFIGLSAPGLMDLRPTPLDQSYKGVEYNAVVFDNLLNKNFVKRVSPWADTLSAVAYVAITVFAVFFISSQWVQVVVIAATVLTLLLTSYVLALQGYWIAVAIPFSCTIVALVFGYGIQYWLEGYQHKFIKDAFKYYVSPTVIDQIVSNPDSLSLGGEKRELSLFFSDIAGFTSISERTEASKLVTLLNIFLTDMTEVIMQGEGTVDKYVGDAIVAFWNAPLRVRDHAFKAVKAALTCQSRIKELQPQFQRDFGVSIKMRVGLNTGVVNVGNFGSKERFNYTVVGDAANLASRLEGANKYFGTLTLISGSTHKALNGLIFSRKVADIKVVGKVEVVSIYEPFDELSPEVEAWMQGYLEGMQHYEDGNLAEALKSFRSIPGDPVARVYTSRIERDVSKGIDSDWEPVWNLDRK